MENILTNNKKLQICECFKPEKYEKGKPEGELNEILVKDPIGRHLLLTNSNRFVFHQNIPW